MVIEGLNLTVTIALALAAFGLILYVVSISLGNKLMKNPPAQEQLSGAYKRVLMITYLSATSSLISIIILIFQFVINITFKVDFDIDVR
jgi:hypothetical protein